MNNKNDYKNFINELVSEYCPSTGYCLFKEFLLSSHPDPRMLIQLKCLEKYKYELSQQSKKDVGWQQTILSWTEKGYAKQFHIIYTKNPNISFTELYSLLFNQTKK
jgi:hypothetical protein